MKCLSGLLLFCLILIGSSTAFAAHGHYTSGVEGIKAASLPPEGFYWKQYYAFYHSKKMTNNQGNRVGNFRLNAYIWANRFIYSSPIEFLGGNLVFDMIIPLQYTNIQMSGVFDDKKFAVGDIMIEPLLIAWHGDSWDTAFGVGVYLPTGEHSIHNQASPGKGFWTGIATLGGTFYFDQEKTWSASILARYEVHSKQRQSHITPGNDFHFEWGIGKVINPYFELGLTGYCSWQTTKDRGTGSSPYKSQNFGIGPEFIFNIPSWAMSVSLRSTWEFASQNTTQGSLTTLSLTKAF